MIPFIQKMLDCDLLDGKGFALDLGSGANQASLVLADMGYEVDAIDKKDFNPGMNSSKKINMINADIRDFSIQESRYAVIICNNVLPFILNKNEVEKIILDMAKGLVSGGKLFFSLFGPKDAWSSDPNMSFFEYEEALKIVQKLPVSIFERSTMEGYGKTMKGDIKYWNIHRFLCIKK